MPRRVACWAQSYPLFSDEPPESFREAKRECRRARVRPKRQLIRIVSPSLDPSPPSTMPRIVAASSSASKPSDGAPSVKPAAAKKPTAHPPYLDLIRVCPLYALLSHFLTSTTTTQEAIASEEDHFAVSRQRIANYLWENYGLDSAVRSRAWIKTNADGEAMIGRSCQGSYEEGAGREYSRRAQPIEELTGPHWHRMASTGTCSFVRHTRLILIQYTELIERGRRGEELVQDDFGTGKGVLGGGISNGSSASQSPPITSLSSMSSFAINTACSQAEEGRSDQAESRSSQESGQADGRRQEDGEEVTRVCESPVAVKDTCLNQSLVLSKLSLELILCTPPLFCDATLL